MLLGILGLLSEILLIMSTRMQVEDSSRIVLKYRGAVIQCSSDRPVQSCLSFTKVLVQAKLITFTHSYRMSEKLETAVLGD